VAAGVFDPRNFRHRRAFDESGPLADLELEAARERVIVCRRVGDRALGATLLREFGRMVGENASR
jgi:hypothetical protein